MMFVFLFLLCFGSTSYAQITKTETPECPVVTTKLGRISGIREKTVLGNESFCSYRGIRYAEPPIGKLRFKAPVKIEPWGGIYNASDYGAACTQEIDEIEYDSSEDCLFLNVFVPNPTDCSNSSDVAVIIYIHGGGFTSDTASDDKYGPHLLLNDCVILVTMNYRLDVFGFLPLALDEYSGNMGLKDQQLALEWVSNHIPAFGGNPKQITLMGESSGGASVSFHRLNAKSRSFFQRAYVMSGSAFNYYTLSPTNNKTDLIVNIAKNQGVEISNTDQLIEYIQTVDSEYILNQTHYSFKNRSLMQFSPIKQPCIELESANNPFLTEVPEVLLARGVADIPTIYTYTAMESVFDVIVNQSEIHRFNENFTFTLPFHNIDQVACREEMAPLFTDIRQFYFGNATIDPSYVVPFIKMSSYYHTYPVYKELSIQSLSKSNAEIRLLIINQQTALNFLSRYVLNLNLTSNEAALAGCTHFDDICSYFWCKDIANVYDEIEPQENLLQKSSVKASKILREILTSFAFTGKPVSETASFYEFPLVGSDPLTRLPFAEYHSMNALVTGNNPGYEEFKFWWNIDQRVEEIKKMQCNQK